MKPELRDYACEALSKELDDIIFKKLSNDEIGTNTVIAVLEMLTEYYSLRRKLIWHQQMVEESKAKREQEQREKFEKLTQPTKPEEKKTPILRKGKRR